MVIVDTSNALWSLGFAREIGVSFSFRMSGRLKRCRPSTREAHDDHFPTTIFQRVD